MMLDKSNFNEKKPEYGVATIGALTLALDTGPVFLSHLLKSLICFSHQLFVLFE
jgi:hypothetical protein